MKQATLIPLLKGKPFFFFLSLFMERRPHMKHYKCYCRSTFKQFL